MYIDRRGRVLWMIDRCGRMHEIKREIRRKKESARNDALFIGYGWVCFGGYLLTDTSRPVKAVGDEAPPKPKKPAVCALARCSILLVSSPAKNVKWPHNVVKSEITQKRLLKVENKYKHTFSVTNAEYSDLTFIFFLCVIWHLEHWLTHALAFWVVGGKNEWIFLHPWPVKNKSIIFYHIFTRQQRTDGHGCMRTDMSLQRDIDR